jgi:FkbM family methyltransferase
MDSLRCSHMSVGMMRTNLRREVPCGRTRLRQDARMFYEMLGMRGILASWANLICGYPEHVTLTPEGTKYPLFVRLRTSDIKVCKDVFLRRDYDYPTCFSPSTIVDVGANCGMTSVFYANRYPDATIVAIEPESSNYEALVRNTSSYSNVCAIQAALWNEDGQVEVFPGDLGYPGWPRMRNWGKWGFHVRKGTGCRALTMATLMREVGMETVDILKVDVEGAEWQIFSSCDWMDKVKLLAIELHDRIRPGCSDVVNAATRQHHKTQCGTVTFYSR